MSTVSLVGRLIVPAGVLVFAVGFYLNIRDMDLESRALPMLLIAAVSLMALVVGVKEIRLIRDAWAGKEAARPEGYSASTGQRLAPIVGLFVLTGIYIMWAIPNVGFYASSFLYCLMVGLLLGLRSVRKLSALSITVTLVSYLVFGLAFGLQLPEGPFL